MKKIFLALTLLLIGLLPAYSQYQVRYSLPIDFRLGAYGSYNFAEKTPNAGAFFSVAAYNMMAEVDVGWAKLDYPGEDFLYLNPSIGFYYGDTFRAYALIGITNWGEYDFWDEHFNTGKVYCKLKAGVDLPLSKKLFLNLNWQYIINDEDHHGPHHGPSDDRLRFKHNALAIGIGYRF